LSKVEFKLKKDYERYEVLLSTRICDLDIHLNKTPYFKWLRQFKSELRARDLFENPQFWVSDEWFSPEGSFGVAIPFYLLDKRLQRLEKKIMGDIEGETEIGFKQLLRHETGHAFDHGYGLMRKKMSVRLFGSDKKVYPKYYKPRLEQGQYFVKHLEGGYAQAHPSEDFAETFAEWLKGERYWEKKYFGLPALLKLRHLDTIMENLITEERRPFKKSGFVCDDYMDNQMTLGRYYENKLVRKQKYEGHGRILM